jgi:cytochrome c556
MLLSCRTGGATAPAQEGALPDVAREFLAPRMQGHAEDMSRIMYSMLLLDGEGVGQLAEVIALEPRLSRPSAPSENTLNAMVPEEFYVLQDELARNANVLVAVASSVDPDPTVMANAYGALATTCVKCHAQFMRR